ncbi:hypothetical protein GCM10027589_35660 [Actinocorallia lasiicapitis]
MGTMRTLANRDANFRGIDTDALAHLIQQMRTASASIEQWLSAHPAPPGVSGTGYRQAVAAQRWIEDQIGMLTRRRIYALTHQDNPDIVAAAPPVKSKPVPTFKEASIPPSELGIPAESDLNVNEQGQFQDVGTATSTGSADATAIRRAVEAKEPIPNEVWQRIQAHAKDPNYAAALYARLGPEGTARLIDAAQGDKARLEALITSLTIADNKVRFDNAWLASVLAEADRLGAGSTAREIFSATPLAPRIDDSINVVPASLITSRAV